MQILQGLRVALTGAVVDQLLADQAHGDRNSGVDEGLVGDADQMIEAGIDQPARVARLHGRRVGEHHIDQAEVLPRLKLC